MFFKCYFSQLEINYKKQFNFSQFFSMSPVCVPQLIYCVQFVFHRSNLL